MEKGKTFLIFKHVRFIGYTKNKKTLKLFLRERGNNFNVHEVDEEFAGEMESNPRNFFTNKELLFIDIYNRTMTREENYRLNTMLSIRFSELHVAYVDLRRIMRYIKFTKEEVSVLGKYLLFMENMIDDLLGNESCVTFNDYFDVESVFNTILQAKQ